jgi:hypothetical protein
METHIQTARQALQRLLTRIKYDQTDLDVAEVDATVIAGMTALDAAEVELRTVRDAHRTAMKALMHRMGDPG